MATTYSSVFGTKPDVTTLLGEDTLSLTYPASIAAGDTLVLWVMGTTAGSTSPTADGLWTGTTWETVNSGKLKFYHVAPVTAAGGETGTITITKGSALSRLVGAGCVKYDASMTYDSWGLYANNIVTNHNGNTASGGSPVSSTTLDDGTTLGFTPPASGQYHRAYTIWFWGAAGNSGHPVTETLAGPDTETLLFSTLKDEQANPSNANTNDQYIRFSDAEVTGSIASVVDTETDTSGFANPNQTLLSLMGFRFFFVNTPHSSAIAYDFWG